MTAPSPANCPRCGRAILRGDVDGLVMSLDPVQIPDADAAVLERYYGGDLAQIQIRARGGQTLVAEAKGYWPGSGADWVTLLRHRCRTVATNGEDSTNAGSGATEAEA